MSTIVQPPKIGRPQASRVTGGGGGLDNLGRGQRTAEDNYAPPPANTGIWVLLAAIGMMFAAFTSALIVRQGAATDWHHLTLPRVLYFNTLVLVASSLTLEIARRRIAVFMGAVRNLGVGTLNEKPATWLWVTLLLGLIFIAGQYAASGT